MIRVADLTALWRSTSRYAIVLCVTSSFSSISIAGANVCDQPADHSFVSVGFNNSEESDVAGINRVDLRSTNFDLRSARHDSWTFGVSHRYDKFGFDPIDLQTNGHLHTLFFPLHRQFRSGRKGFRVSLAPAATASSNVIGHLSRYSSDALNLLVALTWSTSLSDQSTLRYGICGDNSFGEYTLYPSIGIGWKPHADWKIELGFPITRLTFQATRDISSSLRVMPDGNEWYVKDKSLEEDSQFVFEAILAEWAVRWQALDRLSVMASVGRQFDIEYDVTLVDGTRAQFTGDSTTRFGAALEWRF